MRSLLYADGVTLLATTPQGLQRLLDALGEFADASLMTVNTAKTKVMLLAPGAAPQGLQYKGEVLEVVAEFVYLGVPLYTPKGHSTHVRRALHTNQSKRARRWRQCSGSALVSACTTRPSA